MGQVGAFPGMISILKRTVRAPQNPLDVSTIFSIFPREIDETHHTIQPGRFTIAPGTYDKPSFLVVGTSSWWKEMEESQPFLEVPHSSIQVADAVVRNYCSGVLECNLNDTMPGVFFIPGNVSVAKLKTEYKNDLDRANANQRRWFQRLVILADALWTQSNGNPLTISEDMKLAARELNLNGKEWLADFQMMEMVRCAGCGSMRNPQFPICPSCHQIVDQELYKKLNLKTLEK